MQKTFIIDGGLGRVITAIPALEKYVKTQGNCNIITHFWTPILWGNKILTPHVLDASTKNIYKLIKDTKIIKPEPYYNSEYLNGKISLADAWNQELNQDNETMPIPKLYLSRDEHRKGSLVRNNKSTKIIAFQPFGSTAEITETEVYDSTMRSLNADTTKKLVRYLRGQGFSLWLMTDKMIPFLQASDFVNFNSANIREVAAAMSHCDYFVGVDSSGQHLARCMNVPGTVIMGGTNTKNVSYPDFFNILNDDADKTYMPYRMADFDIWLSGIENDGIMDFDDDKITEISKSIVRHLKEHAKQRKS